MSIQWRRLVVHYNRLLNNDKGSRTPFKLDIIIRKAKDYHLTCSLNCDGGFQSFYSLGNSHGTDENVKRDEMYYSERMRTTIMIANSRYLCWFNAI